MEVGFHRGVNEYITVGNNSHEKMKTFNYLGSLQTNQNSVHNEIKCKLKTVQTFCLHDFYDFEN